MKIMVQKKCKPTNERCQLVYTFFMEKPYKWAWFPRKCKAGNETCLFIYEKIKQFFLT
ncbi:hypothetical protein MTBBW1_1060021 [Desulfamplus magnetovallimortis]|uniref:Uncharacterized protein n=1 Tax=Desulfamplus magnetovallimortis TaxID=1246637 RepID=A0A1W1H5B5_9BACT|nr:hypothetical protein MTBBW1_1060021 [Desulfamplus magnetovallimortis]